MYKFQSLILLLIRGFYMASLPADKCPYQECDCDDTEIDCSERELISVPVIYNAEETGYLTLLLDSNEISEIEAGSFPPGLAEISMNGNPVTTIDDNAFYELSTTLQTLYFSNANFTRIPDAFLQLHALQYLSIMDTKIMDWNVKAMGHIGQTLQSLTLENVGLATWPVWLQNFSALKELNIVSSTISSIPNNAFDKLASSLLVLTLYNNSFTAVPKSLSILKNVITLDLHDNKLSNITWLPKSAKLSDLALNNNNISDTDKLSSVLRTYANSLVSLTLSGNHLNPIPDLLFLTSLESLDFSHNEIADGYTGSVPISIDDLNLNHNLLPHIPGIYRNLTFLRHMYLSNNNIQELQGEDIPAWITDLDLSYNFITVLTDVSFSVDSGLRVLTLDYNPLVNISSFAFSNLSSLISLSLQSTKLTRLPLSLLYLTSIRFVDLSDNPDLVCTCQEKSLESQILSDIQLSGSCGAISIYNFFATLDLTCP